MRKVSIIIAMFCCFHTIMAQGSWTPNVSALDIIEAGSDFSSTYESDTDEIILSPSRSPYFYNFYQWGWRVDVRRDDIDWHPDLTLSIRRTGNGTPFYYTGSITGGTTYQTISTSNQFFFSGTYTQRNIPVQIRLEGISVLLPAKTYSTTIVLTLVEN